VTLRPLIINNNKPQRWTTLASALPNSVGTGSERRTNSGPAQLRARLKEDARLTQ